MAKAKRETTDDSERMSEATDAWSRICSEAIPEIDDCTMSQIIAVVHGAAAKTDPHTNLLAEAAVAMKRAVADARAERTGLLKVIAVKRITKGPCSS